MGVFGHFLENAWREWPEIWYAAVSWPPTERIRLWLRSGDFSYFGAILTYWNGSNLGFLGISRRTHRGNGLKLCMLMYLDHLQNWLVYSHGLLFFLILALFWLSQTGQIWGFLAFPGESMEGMVWNMVCCCILTTYRKVKIMFTVWWFFLFWCYFDLVKRVKFGVSRHFLENPLRKWPDILHADVSWRLSELIRLWLQFVDFSNFDAILT